MIFNRIFATLMLTTCLSAAATDKVDTISVEPVIFTSDGEGECVVQLNTDVTEYNGFQMDLYLPEGFTIKKNDQDSYQFAWNHNMVTDHAITIGENNDFLRLVGVSLNQCWITPGNDWLFKFAIKAPSDFEAESTAKIGHIIFAEGADKNHAKGHYMPDQNFLLIPTKLPTGISDVSLDSNNSLYTVYSLQGVCLLHNADRSAVETLPWGLYIVNNKIMLINHQ